MTTPHHPIASLGRAILLLWAIAPLACGVDFHTDIAPLLETKCISCHGADKQKGDLRLDTRAAFAPAAKDVIDRIALPHGDDDIMPPEGDALAAAQIEAVRAWVAAGTPWPDGIALVERDPADLASNPADAAGLASLAVYPPSVSLLTGADAQSLIAVASYADGTTRDVTAKVTLRPDNPALVTVAGNRVTPRADGESAIAVSFHGKSVKVPLSVKSAAAPRPVSFKLDVMPVFMRAGCNTGSCHGAARGQDGFNLSLFGYDPDGDHFRITREWSSRRINLAVPEESMLLEKSLETVPHSGGKLFDKGSPYYNTLLAWLRAGAAKDPADVAHATSLEVFPREAVLEGAGTQQRMLALAHYSDGTTRDVTSLAVFETNNAPSAAVDEDGVVTAGKRGEAFVMARFDTFTVGAQVIVIPADLQYARPAYPAANFIDGLVAEKLHKLRIVPSELCTDVEFLRRATLDITGKLPTEDEFHAFAADASPDKRVRLVDGLLSRKEFTELWVMKFAELLQMRTDPNNGMSYKATLLYYNWLSERVADNVPFNEIVQELLSSTGGTFTSPATNYFQVEKDTLKVAENVAQVFMGMRLQCAQCHNHPFDRWTMDDYYSFAAFFSQIGRKRAQDPRETVVYNRGNGDMKHPVGGQVMEPVFLGAGKPEIKRGSDRRAALGEWMASPQNPYFSRNLANIVWAHFFGAGIIDPVDDVRVSNPPSNPALLAALAERFTGYNYDFKRLVRDICTSRTYGLSTKTNAGNEGDSKNFSHALIRRVRAEVLLDAISQVTETKNKFQGLPLGARAVQIADGNVSNYFLKTFGRAERKTVCSCEVKMEPNLGQALHLINGATTGARVVQGKVVEKMLAEKKSPEQIIESLYLRAFSRKPTETEKVQLLAKIDPDPAKGRKDLEDIFWALLNAKEFMFNH